MHHNRSLLPNVEVLLGVMVKTSTCSNKLLIVILNFYSRLFSWFWSNFRISKFLTEFHNFNLISEFQLDFINFSSFSQKSRKWKTLLSSILCYKKHRTPKNILSWHLWGALEIGILRNSWEVSWAPSPASHAHRAAFSMKKLMDTFTFFMWFVSSIQLITC